MTRLSEFDPHPHSLRNRPIEPVGRHRWAVVAVAAVIVLFLALPASVSAAADDWRPARTDRLAAMDAAMAPMLSALQPAIDAVLQDIGTLTAFVALASPDQMMADLVLRSEAAEMFRSDLGALQGLASSAVGMLREHPPEPCWAEYAAVQTTGWLLTGDSTQSLAAGDLPAADMQLGIGVYLLVGDYAELVHAVAVAECAA